MSNLVYDEFLRSDDTLWVYADEALVFSSQKDRLLALLEYLGGYAAHHHGVTILDRVMGNAAALLAIKAECREVYSPLGSQIAIESLDKYGIKYQIEIRKY